MMRHMGGNQRRWLYGVMVVGGIGVLLSVTLMGRSVLAGPKPEVHRQARQPAQSAPSTQSGQSTQQQTLTGGTCLHAGWNVTPSQNPGIASTFYAVSAVSAADAWAVGYDNPDAFSGQEPVAEHFDGHQWTTTTVPMGSGTSAELDGVAARAANDVWVVGSQAGGTTEQTLVELWNGSQWAIVASPNHGTDPTLLKDVAVTSDTDAWAVGFYSFNDNSTDAQFIEHWDGTAWTTVTGADTGLSDVELHAVSASSSTNVWILGIGADTQNTYQPFVENWNGTAWTSTILPQIANQTISTGKLTIAPDGTVWVAGTVFDQTVGHAVPVAMRRDSSSGVWAAVSSTDVGSLGSGFGAIGISPAGDMWAVGSYALSTGFAADHVLIERWNGSAFVQWPYGDGTTATQYGNLVAIAVVSSDAALAVGGTGASNANALTFAEEYLRTVPSINCSTGG